MTMIEKIEVPKLPSKEEHRLWIRTRIATLLSHYPTGDDANMLRVQAMDWVKLLEPYSREEIDAAVLLCLDESPYKPVPADVTRRIRRARALAAQTNQDDARKVLEQKAEMVRQAVEDDKGYLLTTIPATAIRQMRDEGLITADIAKKAGA